MSWTDCNLEDAVKLQRGHDLPERRRKDGPVPIVSSSGITGRHNVAKAEPPGVVTGRYGTIGQVFYVDEPYWPLNTALYAIDFKGNDPRFVAYLLENTLRNYRSEKAAVPGVDRNVLHKLKVRITNREGQERIAQVLSSYDDLIQNNRQRIGLLEEAARLLYREWFVQFRFPGHEHVRMIGYLPEGWRRVRLGDLTSKLGSGATPRGGESSYSESGTPLIRSLNVYDDRFESEGLAFLRDEQAAALDEVTVVPEDILLNITGASVARCCMAPRRYLPARVNQHVMIIRVRHDCANTYFVHAAINSYECKRQLLTIAKGKGATREALTKDIIEKFGIVIPPWPLMKLFGEAARGWSSQRECLSGLNEKLAQTRNLLLPRLMSGEIAV